MHRHYAVCYAVGASMLALAGVGFGANHAYAQAVEACPLPPGVTPPRNPTVTAQQVEQGGDLRAFLLSVPDITRNMFRTATGLQQLSYFGCVSRQEGSVWRSGSTYIVQVTLNGRVAVHTKDMSLGGGLLNPRIYAVILSSLGVPQAVLDDLASSDADRAKAAQAALMAVLLQEPDAAFDAGLPGASGHAAVFVSPVERIPSLMIAGFDLDKSHLVEEKIDHIEPSAAASDVVDRETLKAFVKEAGNYIADLCESGDGLGYLTAKRAMKDPNGLWMHGSVYLGVTDRLANIIHNRCSPEQFQLDQPCAPAR